METGEQQSNCSLKEGCFRSSDMHNPKAIINDVIASNHLDFSSDIKLESVRHISKDEFEKLSV